MIRACCLSQGTPGGYVLAQGFWANPGSAASPASATFGASKHHAGYSYYTSSISPQGSGGSGITTQTGCRGHRGGSSRASVWGSGIRAVSRFLKDMKEWESWAHRGTNFWLRGKIPLPSQAEFLGNYLPVLLHPMAAAMGLSVSQRRAVTPSRHLGHLWIWQYKIFWLCPAHLPGSLV